jgi:hypothetical protein
MAMALVDELFKRNLLTGVAIGIGATMLAPVLVPALAQIVKPAAKAAIKGGIALYARGRETLAEVTEAAEDILAEVQAELAEEMPAAGGSGAAPTEAETEVEAGPPSQA